MNECIEYLNKCSGRKEREFDIWKTDYNKTEHIPRISMDYDVFIEFMKEDIHKMYYLLLQKYSDHEVSDYLNKHTGMYHNSFLLYSCFLFSFY